ncbi:MAG: hypothetical protein KDA24_30300 [Deltaproteobacteria bacterium]|nr:hypothetical protein [Deltaproteobacteria bacterium]
MSLRILTVLATLLLLVGCDDLQLDELSDVEGSTELAMGPPNGLPPQANPNAGENANFGCALPSSCQALDNRWEQELDVQIGCDTVDDCTTVIQGVSCGCTRNMVGNEDTDISCLSDLADELYAQGCVQYHPFISTCDCPTVDGFACVDNRCTWNYAPRTLEPTP